ncbi:hypothetical protein BCR42DRAFT_393270 [Absidia repens]|uniref:Secreted protein n=1 Tax=Absidia repens TaxID=90262 RepID=A0A1X2IF93_9FUNG|nr:hypothetical protein BCR42DRAFT_393270 [Absidia repens]
MMRMLGLALLGSFLWLSSSSIVHAQDYFDYSGFLIQPRIALYACYVDEGKCTYEIYVTKNDKTTQYKIPPTDCNSVQSNGYTFTKALDNESYHAQSPCNPMSIDTLKRDSPFDAYCKWFRGPICQKKKTSTTTTT